MRFLIALLLALPAAAQSGSFNVPRTAAPAVIDLSASMPPPDPGRTHLNVHVYTTWSQEMCVTSTLPTPAFTSYDWTNVQRFKSGGVYLNDMRRSYAHVDFIVPAMSTACGSTRSQSDVSIDLSVNTLALLGPLTIESSVGVGVWVPPNGSTATTTTSIAMFCTFEYYP